MKKILYLLPPSEGKNPENTFPSEKLSFLFEKPLKIAKNATPKDLKCKEKRFEEAQYLNENITTSKTNFAISRYDGVMYKAIDYQNMSIKGQKYFEKHFLILSGMYGILKPKDHIANYKLPIETSGLTTFWKEKITQILEQMEVDIIVDFLPNSYKKMIDFSHLNKTIYHIEFQEEKNGVSKKMTHGVKKIKGEFIKNICEHGTGFLEHYPQKIEKNKVLFFIK